MGIDLLPILFEAILWSHKYLSIAPQAREFAALLKQDKKGMMGHISEGLKKN